MNVENIRMRLSVTGECTDCWSSSRLYAVIYILKTLLSAVTNLVHHDALKADYSFSPWHTLHQSTARAVCDMP